MKNNLNSDPFNRDAQNEIGDEMDDDIENEIDDEIIETDPDENVHHPLLDDDPSHQELIKKQDGSGLSHQSGFNNYMPDARDNNEIELK